MAAQAAQVLEASLQDKNSKGGPRRMPVWALYALLNPSWAVHIGLFFSLILGAGIAVAFAPANGDSTRVRLGSVLLFLVVIAVLSIRIIGLSPNLKRPHQAGVQGEAGGAGPSTLLWL